MEDHEPPEGSDCQIAALLQKTPGGDGPWGHFKMSRCIIETKEIDDGIPASWRCPVKGCLHGLQCEASLALARNARVRHGVQAHPRVCRKRFLQKAGEMLISKLPSLQFGKCLEIMRKSVHDLKMTNGPLLRATKLFSDTQTVLFCQECGIIAPLGPRGTAMLHEFGDTERRTWTRACPPTESRRGPGHGPTLAKHDAWIAAAKQALRRKCSETRRSRLLEFIEQLEGVRAIRERAIAAAKRL
jgi:hypothetical protein